MLCLSNEVVEMLKSHKPKQNISIASGFIVLYCGEGANLLMNSGFLNFVFISDKDKYYAHKISEFISTPIKIKNQEKMKNLDSSFIVGIEIDNGKISAQHWNGFNTMFHLESLEVLSQKFTK